MGPSAEIPSHIFLLKEKITPRVFFGTRPKFPIYFCKKKADYKSALAYHKGLEPLTFWSVAKRSIQLS